LGAVKIQIKKDHEWNNVSLNNIDVVKFLVKFRWKFDDNYICKNFYTDEVTKSNGIPDFHEEITCLYADLDMYIKKANLYKIQRIILKYIMLGVDFKELSILLEKKLNKTYPVYDLKMLFNSACYKILYEYNYDYQFWLESSSKIKINNNIKYKICSRCKKSLPENVKYFRKRNLKNHNFEYVCRKCNTALVYFSKNKKKKNTKV